MKGELFSRLGIHDDQRCATFTELPNGFEVGKRRVDGEMVCPVRLGQDDRQPTDLGYTHLPLHLPPHMTAKSDKSRLANQTP